MNYAIAGGAIVGAAQLNESLLDTITRRLRASLRDFMNTINQKGNPL
ncbi:protease FtsH-inhibitory lysogeny factor CIII [Pantoea anthophila]